MNVYLAGKKLRLDPTRSIGKGGEADVFDIGGGRALKLFKPPDHPDLAGDPEQQEAARQRLEEHQRKLRAFPAGLPARVVCPEELATARDGRLVIGYAMRLLTGAEALYRYGEPGFRKTAAPGDTIAAIFRDLHVTLTALHAAGVVIGDFNDLNVLVQGACAHLIDADSFQFGPFPCRVYTERFVDPLLCDPAAGRPILLRPHTRDSDWYAYAVMLMRSLLCVDPYGGVFKPGPTSPRLGPAARPLHRITVFHPEVRYPRPALSPDLLPDDLLEHFRRVFERDLRGAFPLRLLEDLRFTRCLTCGAEHARGACPVCRAAPPAALREVTVVHGPVTATRVFRTRGRILAAATESGVLRLLVHEDGAFKREDGSTVLQGEADPRMRVRLSGSRTLLARDGALVVMAPDRPPTRLGVETVGGRPACDANTRRAFWVDAGRLMRDGPLGPERVGEVLPGQTRFWVGPAFGFGFYRAGQLSVAFVFSTEGHGIHDGVALPPLRGQLLDASCVFTEDRCFFLTARQEAGRTLNRCVLLRSDGSIVATAEAAAGDGSWLGGIRGRCAAGPHLFAPTDDGIVRVEAKDGALLETRRFPDTEPFVDAGSRLLPGRDGLYVVDRQEVRLLRL